MRSIVFGLSGGILLFLTLGVKAQDNVRTIGTLPNVISESSGLLYFNKKLITHNDSGNEAKLYELDSLTLSIDRTVTITNATNTDWEAITQDEEYIYIGDFGNNLGLRRDLTIYRISKSDYLSSDTVMATISSFSYEDQMEFTDNGNSDWDAEAFFVLDDALVILTKQWQSQGCVAYSIPKIPGSYVATRVGAVEDVGLVTDATYDPDTNRLVVMGYLNILLPFIGIVENVDSDAVLDGFVKVPLALNFVQAEGITQTSATHYFFTSESYSRQNPTITSAPRLFSFQLAIPDATAPEEPENPEAPENPESPEEPENPEIPIEPDNPDEINDQLLVVKDNSTNAYHYRLTTQQNIYGQIIFDALGRPVWQKSGSIEKEGMLPDHLETAIYYLTLYLDNGVIATPFAVY